MKQTPDLLGIIGNYWHFKANGADKMSINCEPYSALDWNSNKFGRNWTVWRVNDTHSELDEARGGESSMELV